MTEFQKKFGLRVKELRKKQGLTQEQLAELLNIGVRSLGKIETGNSFPAPENLENIIKVLKTTPVEIFDFEHLQSPANLEELTIDMIKAHPNKIEAVYKVVKAIVS